MSVSNAVSTSIPLRTIVQRVFPACFALQDESGRYVTAVHADGVTVAKAELLGAAVLFRPAKPEEVVAVYCTGLELAGYAVDPETISTDLCTMPNFDRIDVRIRPASALLGLRVVKPGLHQLNITIPNVPDGDQPFLLIVKGVRTQQELFLSR